MNKSKRAKPILKSIPILLLLFSLFSCISGFEDELVGIWKGSDFLFVKTSGPDLVATINGGLDQHISSKLILFEDGTYELLVGQYDAGAGTWKVADKQLIISGKNGTDMIYSLLKVSESELVTSHEVSIDTPDGEIKGEITLSYIREKN